MMNLVIDIGNNATKVGIFQFDELLFQKTYSTLETKHIEWIKNKYPFENSIISHVSNYDESIELYLAQHARFFKLNHDTSLPIVIKYKTPHTLGRDRIASSVAASALFPEKNILIIDAGTSINYDFINLKKEFLGGAISPGFEMRLKALHHFTARLPLLDLNAIDYLIGKTTEENILSGVINGTIGEVAYFIEQYQKLFPDLHVVLTGGDAPLFENRLNCKIFAVPNLVLIGLNQIIRHYVA